MFSNINKREKNYYIMFLNPDQKFLRRIVNIGKRLHSMASSIGKAMMSSEKRSRLREIHEAEVVAANSKEDFYKIGKYIKEIKDRQEEIIHRFERADIEQERINRRRRLADMKKLREERERELRELAKQQHSEIEDVEEDLEKDINKTRKGILSFLRKKDKANKKIAEVRYA